MNRWQAGNTLRALQHDLPVVRRSIAASSREYSSSTKLRQDDEASIPPTHRQPSKPQSDTSMGIGSSTTMLDQKQSTAKLITTHATDTPLKITHRYQDFSLPPPTSRGGRRGNSDARSLGASRLQGPRLQLDPAARARIEANRRNAGVAAAGAGRFLRATGGRGGGGRGGRPTGRGDSRMRPRPRRENAGSEDEGTAEEIAEGNAKLEAHFAPPPRKWVDHVPEDLSLEDLRVDWPTIPTGSVGMVTGIEEKLRWMARRMQHGYDTPQQLAQRLHKGKELVHFESAEEKEEVLKIARGLAERAASRTTERTGTEVQPKDNSFEPIREKDRAVLSEELIKGVYPPIEAVKTAKKAEGGKQTPAFLNEVVRMLGNNETYHAKEKGQLCFTIQKLLKPMQRPAGA